MNKLNPEQTLPLREADIITPPPQPEAPRKPRKKFRISKWGPEGTFASRFERALRHNNSIHNAEAEALAEDVAATEASLIAEVGDEDDNPEPGTSGWGEYDEYPI